MTQKLDQKTRLCLSRTRLLEVFSCSSRTRNKKFTEFLNEILKHVLSRSWRSLILKVYMRQPWSMSRSAAMKVQESKVNVDPIENMLFILRSIKLSIAFLSKALAWHAICPCLMNDNLVMGLLRTRIGWLRHKLNSMVNARKTVYTGLGR